VADLVSGYRARPHDGAAGPWLYVEALFELEDYYSEHGCTLVVERFDMPRDEYEKLGDFDGW